MQTAMKTSDMQSGPKTACNQILTQAEVTGNIYSQATFIPHVNTKFQVQNKATNGH